MGRVGKELRAADLEQLFFERREELRAAAEADSERLAEELRAAKEAAIERILAEANADPRVLASKILRMSLGWE